MLTQKVFPGKFLATAQKHAIVVIKMRPISQEEKRILEGAKNGGLEEFEKILYLYEKPIYRYIYRMVAHRQNAEDLTQETFLKFYRHIGSLDPEQGCRALLYRIATNTVYDWLRKEKTSPEVFTVDDPEHPFETIDEHAAYYDDRERVEIIEELAQELPHLRPEYRSVVLLFYYEGFDYQSIADMLSLPLNTVKTYLHRAKQELQKKLTRPH